MQAQDKVSSAPAPAIDLPLIFEAAEDVSVRGQQRTKRRIIAQLVALNLAAACGALTLTTGVGATTLGWTGLVAALAFLVVIVLQITQHIQKPEQAWYDGRAVAESVKSLAWKYAVGSIPFGVGDIDSAGVDQLFIGRLQDIVRQMDDLQFSLPAGREDDHISPSMRALRAQPLATRKEAYQQGRVRDQYSWYSSKAEWNRKRGEDSSLILIAIAAVGILAGLARAAGLSQLNLLGLAATAIVSIFTLLRLNQRETLARAYRIAAVELNTISRRVDSVTSEEDWSKFVAEAEEAISREHTLWLASYTSAPQSS